jgi:hypothetical protein
MNHIGDTNKMVDTPRTDAAKKIVLGGVGGDWEVVHIAFSRQLERELNAANVEMDEKRKDVVWLATEKAKLEERIKRLEEAGDNMVTEEDVFIRLKIWTKAKEAKP